ncbi:MAG: hypothetical protein WA705_08840 [Candidatus Ozemobacteraceae bacterium]
MTDGKNQMIWIKTGHNANKSLQRVRSRAAEFSVLDNGADFIRAVSIRQSAIVPGPSCQTNRPDKRQDKRSYQKPEFVLGRGQTDRTVKFFSQLVDCKRYI